MVHQSNLERRGLGPRKFGLFRHVRLLPPSHFQEAVEPIPLETNLPRQPAKVPPRLGRVMTYGRQGGLAFE